MTNTQHKKIDEIFALYHHREFVHPNPLEFLYAYPELPDDFALTRLGIRKDVGRDHQL